MMKIVIHEDREQTQYITFLLKRQTQWTPKGASIYPWCKVRVIYGVVLKTNEFQCYGFDL